MAGNVTPGRWIGMGWGIFKEDAGNFILIALIGIALLPIGSILVAGPLLAGMFIVAKRRILEARTDLMDLFAGFSTFVDALLAFIITMIFAFVGLVLCVFPVLIVAALYLYTYLFLVDRKLPFWDAMESSRRLVAQNLLGHLLFVVLLLLLNLVGLILGGVGLLVTIPVSAAAITVAYKETAGFIALPVEAHGPVHIP